MHETFFLLLWANYNKNKKTVNRHFTHLITSLRTSSSSPSTATAAATLPSVPGLRAPPRHTPDTTTTEGEEESGWASRIRLIFVKKKIAFFPQSKLQRGRKYTKIDSY